MDPTIFIDALGIDKSGGGRTSIHTLFDHVFQLDQTTRYIVLVSAHEPSWDRYPNVQQRVISGGRFFVRLYLQCKLPRWVRQENAALVHFTKNLGVFGLPCPYVVTVHDLTTLLLSDQHTPIDVAYWRWIEPQTVRQAKRVVAVSHTTAADIERFYRIPQYDIQVIPWAPHPRFVPIKDSQALRNMRQKYNLPERYILFLGILAKKKNLPTLLNSLAHLHTQKPDAPDLAVVGRRYPQSDDTESILLVHQLGLDDQVHFVGDVPDKDLPLLYSASKLYVLPSLHEGFGIPCLEAMACGTPVIATRVGALPEIVGDAGSIIDDPFDEAALSKAMGKLLYDKELRTEIVQRGFKRAAEFSWIESAQKMLAVYQSVPESKNQ
jgi:glycosyltransferase involved in cell wall biosynthesis